MGKKWRNFKKRVKAFVEKSISIKALIDDEVVVEILQNAKLNIDTAGENPIPYGYAIPSFDDEFAVVAVDNVASVCFFLDEKIAECGVKDGFSKEIFGENKGCVYKKLMGYQLLKQIKREISVGEKKLTDRELQNLARSSRACISFFDIDNMNFYSAISLRGQIDGYLSEHCLDCAIESSEKVRVIYDSMALKYALVLEDLSKSLDYSFGKIYLVLEKSEDELLASLISEYTNLPIICLLNSSYAVGCEMLDLIENGVIKDRKSGVEFLAKVCKTSTIYPTGEGKYKLFYEKYKAFINRQS